MNTSKIPLKLIIGLGNPGAEYKNTYHNVGALFSDEFKKYLIDLIDSHQWINHNIPIFSSTVYVNNSGSFVAKMIKKYNVKPEELLIAHDDSDITLGNYKFSFDRGAAGHHGIENIQHTLKTNKFWRLRIGIRPPPASGIKKGELRLKAEKFVLKKITATDKKTLEETFRKILLKLKGNSK